MPPGTLSSKPQGIETIPWGFVVPVTGLEPVRHRWRWILSPLRLPFHHTGIVLIYYSIHQREMQEKLLPNRREQKLRCLLLRRRI